MEKSDRARQGRNNRKRGNAAEYRLVNTALEAGLTAKRQPLSGAVKGFEGDVIIEGIRHSVKTSKRGFAYDSELEDNDALVTFHTFTRGKVPVVRIPLPRYLELLSFEKRILTLRAINELKETYFNEET